MLQTLFKLMFATPTKSLPPKNDDANGGCFNFDRFERITPSTHQSKMAEEEDCVAGRASIPQGSPSKEPDDKQWPKHISATDPQTIAPTGASVLIRNMMTGGKANFIHVVHIDTSSIVLRRRRQSCWIPA
jgi:hypothetical protein